MVNAKDTPPAAVVGVRLWNDMVYLVNRLVAQCAFGKVKSFVL